MPHRTSQLSLITGVLLVLFAVAIFGVQEESLWLDESWSAWIVYDPVPELDGLTDTLRYLRDSALTTLQRVREDMHPPLYFFFMEGWTLLVDESEFALRLPSVLAGLLGLAATYAVGRQWLGWKGALFALAILGTSGFFLHYAREARMYALLLAFSALATWAYGLWWRRMNLWRGLLYALALTLALYTHYLAALLIPAHFLHSLITRPRWRMAFPVLVAGLFFAPWVPFFWRQFQAHSGASMGAYLPGDSNTLAGFWLIFTSGYWYIFLLPFALGTALPDALRRSHERGAALLLFLWLILPLLVLLPLNAPERTLLQLRYLLYSLPAWALLIAYGLTKVRISYAAWALLVWIVFTQLSMFADLWPQKPRWRDAVQSAAQTRTSAEPALIHLAPHSPAAYYDRRYPLRTGISLDVGWRSFSPGDMRRVAAALDQAPAVWAMLPAQDPSSWDALAALSDGRGIGYRDGVQGTLFYRFDAASRQGFAFTFGDLLAYDGEIVVPHTLTQDEGCVRVRVRPLVTLPDAYEIGLYLTRGYNEVLAQAVVPLAAADVGASIEAEPCIDVGLGLPPGELHLRMTVHERATSQRLPLLESGILWGDFLIVGRVE